LALSSLGWEVLATDIPPVISTVLATNIKHNLLPSSGPIQIRELDWTVPPHDWVWDDNKVVSSQSRTSPESPSDSVNLLNPPYDLICAADTVYIPSLLQPLLRTLHTLCKLSVAASPASRSPPIYICIERRDPALVDRLLSEARTTWGFLVVRIPHRRLAKAMEKGKVAWAKEDWEGIEIWKMTLPSEYIF
jgi:protein N-lysine methyltransferase METTL21D